VLTGGTAAWKAAGYATEAGEQHMADLAEDAWYRPYDRKAGVEAAMKDYLNWELDLVAQIERDGDARFKMARTPEENPSPARQRGEGRVGPGRRGSSDSRHISA